MRVQRTTLITTVVFLAAVGLAVFLGGPSAEPATGPDAPVRTVVRVETLRLRRLAGATDAGGFLRAAADVTVSAERAGRVVAFLVAEGEPVTLGAIVAELDDTVAAANWERARAVARETALAPDASAAELARAREQERLAEHEVALRNPVAPIAGRVEIHHVDVGETVQPGTPLLDIVDASRVILDVDVDAEVVGFLAVGASATVRVPARPDLGDRAGTVTRVAARAGGRTRRFRVEVTVDAVDGAIRAGMYAVARFTLPPGPPSLYVPKEAVRTLRGGRGVFLVEDRGVARWRPVSVEEVAARAALWRVQEGALANGARVVVAGFEGLRDGAPVTIDAGPVAGSDG